MSTRNKGGIAILVFFVLLFLQAYFNWEFSPWEQSIAAVCFIFAVVMVIFGPWLDKGR